MQLDLSRINAWDNGATNVWRPSALEVIRPTKAAAGDAGSSHLPGQVSNLIKSGNQNPTLGSNSRIPASICPLSHWRWAGNFRMTTGDRLLFTWPTLPHDPLWSADGMRGGSQSL